MFLPSMRALTKITCQADKQFDFIRGYIKQLPDAVEKGIGLYIYSTPTEGNPLGTGTGKTTSAIAILNEFTKLQVKKACARADSS